MGTALRILHMADSHIGANLPVRPRLAVPRRGDDFVRSYEWVLDQALAQQVDLVIHAGDLFDRSKPTSRALVAAAQPLLHVAATGVPIVVVPGNHERSQIPGTLLLAHPNIHVLAQPATKVFRLHGTRVAVSGFPCLRRHSAQRFEAVLAQTEWDAVDADVRILAVHQTFESATCGPADYRFRSADDVIERSAVPPSFDYVAAGHIHRHQVLFAPALTGKTPTDSDDSTVDARCPGGVRPQAAHAEGRVPIVYAGSPDRISMAEKDEPKGYVLVEWAGHQLTHTFVAHAVRPMVAYPIDITGWSTGRIREELEGVLVGLPRDAVAQVRLTGCVTAGTLAGLRLTGIARQLRPDVLFSASTQSVEYVPRTLSLASVTPSSALHSISAPTEPITRVNREDVSPLHTGCGVYALYDKQGRLLYVGKSKTVRARVRTHLRGGTGAHRFDGWSAHVAHIEARPSCSELEALLIEADLVRRLRPAFNRQMRRWRAYCHLVDGGPFGGLSVATDPPTTSRCFGPFRSRGFAQALIDAAGDHFQLALCDKQATADSALPLLGGSVQGLWCHRYTAGLCTAPCAGRIDRAAYEKRLRARDALLHGIDDASLVALEEELEDVRTRDVQGEGPSDETQHRLLSRQAATLRSAFDLGATIRRAKALMLGMLILPGDSRGARTVTLTPSGLHFDILAHDLASAQRVRANHLRRTSSWATRHPHVLPKAVMDALCIAVRKLQDESTTCIALDRPSVINTKPEALLALVQDRSDPSRMVS